MSDPDGLRAGVEPKTLEDFAVLHDAIDHTLNRATAKLLRDAADELRALLAKHPPTESCNCCWTNMEGRIDVTGNCPIHGKQTASPPSEPSPVEQEKP